YCDLYIPSGVKPVLGWPVAILGHGGGSNKFFGLPRSAASLAAKGIARIAVNVAGHGLGPLGTVWVDLGGGRSVYLPARGRGIDQNGDGIIEVSEGRYATPPRRFVVDDADSARQTIADLMELVQVIQVGMDVDGDELPDLDASRIYFFGQSYGASFGAVFLA